jgi:hypothetical protein
MLGPSRLGPNRSDRLGFLDPSFDEFCNSSAVDCRVLLDFAALYDKRSDASISNGCETAVLRGPFTDEHSKTRGRNSHLAVETVNKV